MSTSIRPNARSVSSASALFGAVVRAVREATATLVPDGTSIPLIRARPAPIGDRPGIGGGLWPERTGARAGERSRDRAGRRAGWSRIAGVALRRARSRMDGRRALELLYGGPDHPGLAGSSGGTVVEGSGSGLAGETIGPGTGVPLVRDDRFASVANHGIAGVRESTGEAGGETRRGRRAAAPRMPRTSAKPASLRSGSYTVGISSRRRGRGFSSWTSTRRTSGFSTSALSITCAGCPPRRNSSPLSGRHRAGSRRGGFLETEFARDLGTLGLEGGSSVAARFFCAAFPLSGDVTRRRSFRPAAWAVGSGPPRAGPRGTPSPPPGPVGARCAAANRSLLRDERSRRSALRDPHAARRSARAPDLPPRHARRLGPPLRPQRMSGPDPRDCLAACILGPTAVGKTEVALLVAGNDPAWRSFPSTAGRSTAGSSSGTAKPTAAERARVRHHLLDALDPGEISSARRFRDLALVALKEAGERSARLLGVGGAGLYWEALVRGLHDLPPRPPRKFGHGTFGCWRKKVPTLHRRLRTVDPPTATRLAPGDHAARQPRPRGVHELTGRPLSALHQGLVPTRGQFRPWRSSAIVPTCIGASRSAAPAYSRSRPRGELRDLLATRVPADAPGLRTVGYREFLPHLLEGKPLSAGVEEFVRDSRRYAKRQGTWLRHRVPEAVVLRIEPDEVAEETAGG